MAVKKFIHLTTIEDYGSNKEYDLKFHIDLCKTGSIELFEKFNNIKGLVNIYYDKYYPVNELFKAACEIGSIEIAKKCIENGFNIGFLYIACLYKNYKLIDIILEKEPVYYLDFGLRGACEANDFELVKKMISLGANKYDKALSYLYKNKDIDIRIIDLFGYIYDGKYTIDAFYNACESGSLKVVKRFVPLINEHDLIWGFYRSCIGRNYDVFMYMKDLVTVYNNMDPQIPYTEMFRHNIYSDKICKELEKLGAKPNKDIFERALLMNFYKYIIRFPNEYKKNIDEKYYREFDVEIIKFLYLNSKRITFYKLTGFRGYYGYRKHISCSISCRFNSTIRIQNFKILFNNHLQKKI